MIAAVLAASLGVASPSALPAQRTARATIGTVDTVRLWSQALGTTKRLLVYRPPSYATSPTRRYPVLYALHGLRGTETHWALQGRLPAVMDSLARAGRGEAIVVMPDGDDGWYSTWHTLPDIGACRRDTTRTEPAATYCVPWPHYDDYLATDVVRHIDAAYRTRAARAHRAIAGLSMGGFGAITLALRYPERFIAAASHSGVLVPRYLGPHPYAAPVRLAATPGELRDAMGRMWWSVGPVFGPDTIGWARREPAWLLTQARARGVLPELFVDCGTEDTLIDQSRAFRARLLADGVPHTYAEWPGAHDWAYWRAHVGESAAWLLARVTTRDQRAR
ncbi:MAG: alpha/beta hydrolase-fold protein [Gemmatimonadaceae bacterium]|nr:alpha/beta hydrolase-fold protein [Gemmatimonadaceae bacterium]